MPPAKLDIARQRFLARAIDLKLPERQRGVDLLRDLFGQPLVRPGRTNSAILLLVCVVKVFRTEDGLC